MCDLGKFFSPWSQFQLMLYTPRMCLQTQIRSILYNMDVRREGHSVDPLSSHRNSNSKSDLNASPLT